MRRAAPVGQDPITCRGKVIVDSDGNRIGYVKFLEVMLEQLVAAGVRVTTGQPVTSIESGVVSFATRPPIAAELVILAVPQYPLLEILRASPSLGVSESVYRAVHAAQPVHAVKFYLYYEDAWWITLLNQTEGSFTAPGNAVSPPLEGRCKLSQGRGKSLLSN